MGCMKPLLVPMKRTLSVSPSFMPALLASLAVFLIGARTRTQHAIQDREVVGN